MIAADNRRRSRWAPAVRGLMKSRLVRQILFRDRQFFSCAANFATLRPSGRRRLRRGGAGFYSF